MALQEINGVSKNETTSTDVSLNGFIVTGNAYRHFMTRNGMNGLIEELINTLPPEKAAEIISKRFEQSRYNSEEIGILRSYYQQLKKPVNLYAHVVCSITGEPIESLESVTKQGINSFDVLSDGIVQIWQSCWQKENLERLHYQLEQTRTADPVQRNFEVVLRIEEALESNVTIPEEQDVDFLSFEGFQASLKSPKKTSNIRVVCPIAVKIKNLLTKK